MGENLRTYSRLLTAKLKDKEEKLADLEKRFSQLQNRFAQLDYAFKKNLDLHQQQIIEIYELRNSQKELCRIDEKRWKEFHELEEQLMRVTKGKEIAENGMAYWKQATTDEKKFHQGKHEEFMRSCNLRLREEVTIREKEYREKESLAKMHIQRLTDLQKSAEEKTEAIKEKAIVLQGDVDVLKYRTEELAQLLKTLPQRNESLKAVGFCIVEVLKSFSLSNEEYERKMKELRRELIQRNSLSTLGQKSEIISDYESLKNQNLALRGVVKKLKNDLTQLKKREPIVSNPRAEEKSGKNRPSGELIRQITEDKKLANLIAETDDEMRKSETEKQNVDIAIAANKIERNNGDLIMNKFVQTDENKLKVKHFANNEESQESDDGKSSETCSAVHRKKKVEKVEEERVAGDTMKSFELNSQFLNSDERISDERNEFTVKGEQKVVQNINTDINPDKTECPRVCSDRLEPVDSHLNSIRYKEYTIPLSRKDHIKIRHPLSSEGILRALSVVYSEEEYQNTQADRAVLYFNFENIDVVVHPSHRNIQSRLTNCGTQTLPIQTANVFSQTITTGEHLSNLTGTGVKMLNSEKRAIERGLRDLERTVSEASKETLEESRAVIISSTRFPASEEFFDCIKYLSKSCGDA